MRIVMSHRIELKPLKFRRRCWAVRRCVPICLQLGAGRSRKTPVKPVSVKQEVNCGIKCHC